MTRKPLDGRSAPGTNRHKEGFSFVWAEVIKELVFFVIRYGSDFLQGSLVVLGILAFAWLVRLLAFLGLGERYVAVFEQIHFAASSVVYTLLCLDFVARLGITIWSRLQTQWGKLWSFRSAIALYGEDSKVRWRLLYACMVLVFLVTYSALRIGASPEQSLCVTVAFSFLAYTAGVVKYRRNSEKRFRLQTVSPSAKQFLALASGLAVAALVFLVVSVETPSLAAAVLNRRLQVVLQIKATDRRLTETRRILKLATESHAPLRPELVTKAKEEVITSSDHGFADADKTAKEWSAQVDDVVNRFDARFAVNGPPPAGRWDADIQLVGTFNIAAYSAELRYDGHSRLTLQNACFGFVHLQVPDTDNGRKLLDAFSSSTNGCVNVSLERVP